MMYKLRTMSKTHKDEVKALQDKLAEAERAILRLKEELNAMRLRARR